MRRLNAISRFSLVALAALLSLAGCAVKTATPAPSSAPVVFRLAAQVSVFPFEGEKKRFSVIWQRNGDAAGQRNGDAAGQRNGDAIAAQDEILVRGVFGNIVARLRRTSAETTLEWEGETYTAKDAATLAERVFGYAVPIDSLGYWMTGQASPAAAADEQVRRVSGEVVEIRQHGWRIEFEQRDDDGRPQHLRLYSPGGEAEVRIQKWLAG